MPYASEPTDASIPARVTVRCGEAVTAVEISERDVLEGRAVAVGSGAAAPIGGGPPLPAKLRQRSTSDRDPLNDDEIP
jgi:hypothetical protein